jgi:AAA domain
MKPEDDSGLPVVSAAELDEPDPARRWLIEHLWARAGVGIIGGAAKCCKSWLGLDLAVSVASGTPCLDAFHVSEPGGALIYMAEDAATVVKQRLQGLCRHRGLDLAALPIGVITAPSVRLDLPRDQRRLAETVRRHAPRLLLLDPFVRLHRINENQASEVAAVLGYLRQLQRQHDLAVAVVHHARKNGGHASGGQSLRGSGDFFAWVDTALSLRRHRQRLVLSVEHRASAAPEPSTLALTGTENDMHLSIVTREAPGDHHNPPAAVTLDAAVLDALGHAHNRGLPRASLRATLRVRNQSLGQALTRLTASGHITRLGDAWVRLPIPGPTPLDTPPEPERERRVTGA